MWIQRILSSCLFCLLVVSSAQGFIDSVRTRNKNRLPADTSAMVRINRVLIIGNKVTRDFIIQRELSLKPNDTIRIKSLISAIEKDKKKLLNTRLFNSINIRSLEYDQGIVDLLIEVQERWYTFPVPIFELSDRNFNEWWQNYDHDFRRVNYGLKLYQYNVRGRNETLLLTAKFGFTKAFKVTYRLPYLDKRRKQGLILDLNYDERNNLAFETRENILRFANVDETLRKIRFASLTYTYRNSFYHFHGITVEASNTSISDSLRKLNPDYLGNNQSNNLQATGITYTYVYENRDFVSYPLKGSYFASTIRQIGIMKTDDIKKTEIGFTYAKYSQVAKNFYFSNSVTAHVSLQTDVPYNNFSALGYNRQFVRGYEIYLIEGPQYFFNKTTLKKQIFNGTYTLGGPIEQFQELPLTIYAKIYGDFGYVWNYPGYTRGQRLTDTLLRGIGAGFDFVSSHDSTFRLEYSFNAEGENGFFFHVKKEF